MGGAAQYGVNEPPTITSRDCGSSPRSTRRASASPAGDEEERDRPDQHEWQPRERATSAAGIRAVAVPGSSDTIDEVQQHGRDALASVRVERVRREPAGFARREDVLGRTCAEVRAD